MHAVRRPLLREVRTGARRQGSVPLFQDLSEVKRKSLGAQRILSIAIFAIFGHKINWLNLILE